MTLRQRSNAPSQYAPLSEKQLLTGAGRLWKRGKLTGICVTLLQQAGKTESQIDRMLRRRPAEDLLVHDGRRWKLSRLALQE